jgi:hypothetical protein
LLGILKIQTGGTVDIDFKKNGEFIGEHHIAAIFFNPWN